MNKCALSVKHFHILALSSEHRIVYCAHEREVTSEKPESPDLSKRLRNGDGDYFVVNTCVSGDILDQSVNQERTGFNLDGAGDVLPGTLTLGQLKNAANREVVEHLKPQLDDVRELKLREYRKHIEREAPQYRPLLKRENELLDLPPGLTAEKLDLELGSVVAVHKIKSRIEVETKKKVSNLIKDVTTFDEYRENYASLLEQVNDLGKAASSRMSFAVGGRPGLRFLLPSYLAAMRWRYQRRSVAGVATDAIWASASRPKAWALTASLRRSSSESLRRLPRSPARSTRFSSCR